MHQVLESAEGATLSLYLPMFINEQDQDRLGELAHCLKEQIKVTITRGTGLWKEWRKVNNDLRQK